MVYIAAAQRHLLEYLDGASYSSDTDPPVHHLAHAKACMGIVLDALETGNLVDDRPAKGAASTMLMPRVPVSCGQAYERAAAISGEYDEVAKLMDRLPDRGQPDDYQLHLQARRAYEARLIAAGRVTD